MSQPIIDKLIYKKELLWAARNINNDVEKTSRGRKGLRTSQSISHYYTLNEKCSKLQFYDPAINHAEVLGENLE